MQFKKLRPEASLPRYMSEGAAGLDLTAVLDEPVVLAPGQRALIGTGLAMAVPPGYEAQVRPRSGLAVQSGITVLNSPGTIDSDYRGEVKVLLVNLGSEPVRIESRMRIAQLVMARVAHAECVEVDELGASERGQGGFGSTGV